MPALFRRTPSILGPCLRQMTKIHTLLREREKSFIHKNYKKTHRSLSTELHVLFTVI